MAELKINGRLIVDNFYKKFEAIYPYLNPALFYPKEIGGGEVDTSSTLANARGRSLRQDINGYTSTGQAEINVIGEMRIKDFQTEFENLFKVKCAINCRMPNKKFFGLGKTEFKWAAVVNTEFGKMNLHEANAALENHGAQKVTEVRTKGNNLGDKFL